LSMSNQPKIVKDWNAAKENFHAWSNTKKNCELYWQIGIWVLKF
jgi:hypothetical protein